MAHALSPPRHCVQGLSPHRSLTAFSVSARSCCRSSSDRRRSTLPFTSTPSAAQDDSAIPPGVFGLLAEGITLCLLRRLFLLRLLLGVTLFLQHVQALHARLQFLLGLFRRLRRRRPRLQLLDLARRLRRLTVVNAALLIVPLVHRGRRCVREQQRTHRNKPCRFFDGTHAWSPAARTRHVKARSFLSWTARRA